ncbi:MAG: cation:proton antiporter [Methanomicrobiales archaeon]|nr:cation:proton antiporter [Methanomicrobiales archaeon]
MIPFIATALVAFVLYLILTAGSGSFGLWSPVELGMGVLVSCVTAAISRSFFISDTGYRMANPLRWVRFAVYICVPFFLEMARANLDVAYRVITGNIRPGIVRIAPGLKTDFGVLMLANSITLTPGTLTVGVDEATNDLFVHMIHIGMGDEKKEIFESADLFSIFPLTDWIRRIAE